MAVRQRVLLFHPGTSRGAYGGREPFALDLLHLAAPLVASGFEVEVVDRRLDVDWRRRIASGLKVDGGGPVCFGVSASGGPRLRDALEASKFVRMLRPDVPIVWGGPHPSSRPGQTLEHPLVDYVVVGEGEDVFAVLVQSLAERRRPDGVPGVGTKGPGGRLKLAPPGPAVDLEALPRLPYEVLDVPVSFRKRMRGPAEVALTVARAGGGRRMTPGRAVDEIARLVEGHGIGGVHLRDDGVLADEAWARGFCEELLNRGIAGVSLTAPCGVRAILEWHPEFVRLLGRAGLKTLDVRVESGSDRILRVLGAEFTAEDVRKAVARCREADLAPRMAFSAGIPTESVEDVQSTLKLMLEVVESHPRARTGSLQLFRPQPDTWLWNLCVRNGMAEPERLEDWITFGAGPLYTTVDKRKIELASLLSAFIELRPPGLRRGLGWMHRLYARVVRARIRRSFYRFMPEVHAIRYLRASGAP